MRICFVVHGFPPYERTGVEGYTASLARELARRGHVVEVFAPRAAADLPHLSQRRERVDGYGVTWITVNEGPRNPTETLDPPGIAKRFGGFLDRERPDVVHFQHVVKLGVGLVDEARSRGIPTLYTAHDYYAVCHRYTLLRPDLTRCEHLGDAMVCARCDLALAALNERSDELGDYQMGASPEQLDEPAREGLRALIEDGEPGGLGYDYGALDAAFDERQVLDGRRAEAFAGLDRVLCPTEFLAERLRAGGVPPESIVVLPYGIDLAFADQVAARPRAARADARLSIGFLSGMSKHKGAHVLLDAFESLSAPAELHLFGGSSDRAHVERMRARAEAVGAVWHGPFDRHELARCLSQVDVLVVPSIWVENQPIVIREAFAAGRPVVAPDLGAFPESVRDGVDGLLYAPDDPADLARVLARLATEEGLLERLAGGIAPVRDVATQAEELLAQYAEVGDAEVGTNSRDDAAAADVLPSLRELADSHRRLDALPARELFAHAIERLGRLRAGLGVDAEPEAILLQAFRPGAKVADELRDATQESDWMHKSLEAEEAELSWMRETIAGKEAELADVSQERQWLRETLAEKEKETAWLYGLKEDLETALRERGEEVEDLRARLRKMAEVGDRLSAHLRSTAELGLSALEAQGHALGQEVEPLLAILRRTVDDEVQAYDRGEADTRIIDAVVMGVRRGVVRLKELEAELKWRRDEMGAASEAAGRKPASLLLKRTGLGRRALGWRDGEHGGSA